MKFLCQSRFVAASALADAGVNYQTDMQTFWKCSRELLDFRRRHCRDLPDNYASIFRGWWGEVQQWKFLCEPKDAKGSAPAAKLTLENSL